MAGESSDGKFFALSEALYTAFTTIYGNPGLSQIRVHALKLFKIRYEDKEIDPGSCQDDCSDTQSTGRSELESWYIGTDDFKRVHPLFKLGNSISGSSEAITLAASSMLGCTEKEVDLKDGCLSKDACTFRDNLLASWHYKIWKSFDKLRLVLPSTMYDARSDSHTGFEPSEQWYTIRRPSYSLVWAILNDRNYVWSRDGANKLPDLIEECQRILAEMLQATLKVEEQAKWRQTTSDIVLQETDQIRNGVRHIRETMDKLQSIRELAPPKSSEVGETCMEITKYSPTCSEVSLLQSARTREDIQPTNSTALAKTALPSAFFGDPLSYLGTQEGTLLSPDTTSMAPQSGFDGSTVKTPFTMSRLLGKFRKKRQKP